MSDLVAEEVQNGPPVLNSRFLPFLQGLGATDDSDDGHGATPRDPFVDDAAFVGHASEDEKYNVSTERVGSYATESRHPDTIEEFGDPVLPAGPAPDPWRVQRARRAIGRYQQVVQNRRSKKPRRITKAKKDTVVDEDPGVKLSVETLRELDENNRPESAAEWAHMSGDPIALPFHWPCPGITGAVSSGVVVGGSSTARVGTASTATYFNNHIKAPGSATCPSLSHLAKGSARRRRSSTPLACQVHEGLGFKDMLRGDHMRRVAPPTTGDMFFDKVGSQFDNIPRIEDIYGRHEKIVLDDGGRDDDVVTDNYHD